MAHDHNDRQNVSLSLERPWATNDPVQMKVTDPVAGAFHGPGRVAMGEKLMRELPCFQQRPPPRTA